MLAMTSQRPPEQLVSDKFWELLELLHLVS